MADKVDADLEILQDAANSTMSIRDAIRSDTNSTMGTIGQLDGSFEGIAAEEFREWKNIVLKELDDITSHLNKIGEGLEQSGVNYHESDTLSAHNITAEGTLADALRGGAAEVQNAAAGLPQTDPERGPEGYAAPSNDGEVSTRQHVERLERHPSVIKGNELAQDITDKDGPYHEHSGSYERRWALKGFRIRDMSNSNIAINQWAEISEKYGWDETDQHGNFVETGKQNAFRHAYWMAMLTSEGTDIDDAIELGVRHEMDSDKPGEQWGSHDSYTDLVNNEAGAELGAAYRELYHDQLAEEQITGVSGDVPTLEEFVADVIENDGHNPHGTDMDLTSPKG